jgi:hypothetical protein
LARISACNSIHKSWEIVSTNLAASSQRLRFAFVSLSGVREEALWFFQAFCGTKRCDPVIHLSNAAIHSGK